jgi:hypothetical protein
MGWCVEEWANVFSVPLHVLPEMTINSIKKIILLNYMCNIIYCQFFKKILEMIIFMIPTK